MMINIRSVLIIPVLLSLSITSCAYQRDFVLNAEVEVGTTVVRSVGKEKTCETVTLEVVNEKRISMTTYFPNSKMVTTVIAPEITTEVTAAKCGEEKTKQEVYTYPGRMTSLVNKTPCDHIMEFDPYVNTEALGKRVSCVATPFWAMW